MPKSNNFLTILADPKDAQIELVSPLNSTFALRAWNSKCTGDLYLLTNPNLSPRTHMFSSGGKLLTYFVGLKHYCRSWPQLHGQRGPRRAQLDGSEREDVVERPRISP